MVWNDIISWVNSNFAELGVTGLLLLETGKSIFKSLGFNKMLSMTVKPITTSNNVVFSKVTDLMATVKTLMTAVNDLTNSNTSKDAKIETLSNLVVDLAAVANVPLEAKQAFFNGIVQAKVVSESATLVLQKMIEAKSRQDSQAQVLNDSTITALQNGV